MTNDEIVKDRIIAVARERFFEEGFSKISVDELTSALSMSKKTFYQIFESKEDLVTQIMERMMGEVRANVERITTGDQSFVQKLYGLMTFLGMQVSKLGKPFQQDLQRHLPGLWIRIEEFRRERIIENFTRLIEQGMNEGLIRKDVNKRIFLLAFLGAIENIVRPSVLTHESFSAGEAVQGIMGIFFKGIMTAEASGELDKLQQN